MHKYEKKFSLKNQSVKTTIAAIVICFVVGSCLLLGVLGALLNYSTVNKVLDQTLLETAEQASENVSNKIRGIQMAAVEFGTLKEIYSPEVSIEEKKATVDSQTKLYGFSSGNLLDTSGNSYFDSNNYSDREYFKAAMAGKEFISEPIISKLTGKLTFVVAAPIWENGIVNSKVIGVIYFTPDPNFLNDIVSEIKISENSLSYIINKEGTTVADENPELVSIENTIKEASTDKSLEKYAEVEKKLIAGKTGVDSFKFQNETWIMGYAPVKYTDNWGLGVMAQKNDFLGEFYFSLLMTALCMLLFTVAAFFVAIKFANKIGNPLKACSDRLKRLAEGDLNSDIPVVNENNEIGLVAEATEKIIFDFRKIMATLTEVLAEISAGNLVLDIENQNLEKLFVNDFRPMLHSLQTIVQGLNLIMSKITSAGEQVASGSDQVSAAAQTLSQGATEQASSVEELSATLNEFSYQIKDTAESAAMANQLTSDAKVAMLTGQDQMKRMVEAMNLISDTSKEIQKIIKNIDDIAFQTNILALNAAVEAARAGDAGKGFAVVADEVRNLAGKSAESAKNTTELIESSVSAIAKGSAIVAETAKSLDEIMVSAQKSAELIENISRASEEQALSISQVNVGVEQISSVIQNNSATAEESAAASEELSGQAQLLKMLIGKFKLKNASPVLEKKSDFQEDSFIEQQDEDEFLAGKY